MAGWHEPQLFDGWAPELVTAPALWPTVDPSEVGLDEQARWIWPDAGGTGGSGWNEQGVLAGLSEGWSA